MNREYFCPVCKKKLRQRTEGLVCKNSKCDLYFKCSRGWVLITGDLTRNQSIVKEFWSKNRHLHNRKRWAELKERVLFRDDYVCQSCKFQFIEDYYQRKPLHVHHIVPLSRDASLEFDEDNCITLCEDCHKKVHSADKYKYG